MRFERTHYEILGVPMSASAAEIKKRYRQLVRKYHPDVADGKSTSASEFIRITEAYKVLVDPEKRRVYDAKLTYDSPTQPAGPATSAHAGPRPVYQRDVAKLVKDAEVAFIRRRLEQAKELCRQAIHLDKTCARAHAILGDIYKAKRLYEQAINEYSYAVQFNPNDKDSEAKLNQLLERSAPTTFSWEIPHYTLSGQAIFFNIIGWTLAVFLILLINVFPGQPIPWLAQIHLHFIKDWSWNLVGLMFGCGVLTGFLLGVNGLIAHPDDELIYERVDRVWSFIPTGIVLWMFGPIFFLAAAVFYLVFGFAQDMISKSVVKVFAATAAIVLIAALLYPYGKSSVLLLGGNVVFTGALIGWYAGATFGPER